MKQQQMLWVQQKGILGFKFEYVLLVPVRVKILNNDDWIFMQDERVAINRATMTKFGIKVAELTVMFIKE